MTAYQIIEITNANIAFLQPLANEALTDGYKFVQKTVDEWKSGTNAFSKLGEKFWAIIIGDECIACGGLNQDPYTDDKEIGRVRHVYVTRKYRRLGYAKIILELIIVNAREHFTLLRLSTQNPIAASLYESYGFVKIDDYKVTHVKFFSSVGL